MKFDCPILSPPTSPQDNVHPARGRSIVHRTLLGLALFGAFLAPSVCFSAIIAALKPATSISSQVLLVLLVIGLLVVVFMLMMQLVVVARAKRVIDLDRLAFGAGILLAIVIGFFLL